MLGGGRSARIAVEAVPLSEAAARARAAEPGLIEPILTGGDDYEILCTVAPEGLDALRAEAAEAGIPLTAIGTVTSGDGPPGFEMGDGAARVFAAGAFSHF
jgi:thiamine-monophosphate kinase